jgi:hypothetical protein
VEILFLSRNDRDLVIETKLEADQSFLLIVRSHVTVEIADSDRAIASDVLRLVWINALQYVVLVKQIDYFLFVQVANVLLN